MKKYICICMSAFLCLSGCSFFNKSSPEKISNKDSQYIDSEYKNKEIIIKIKSKSNIHSLYTIQLSTNGITTGNTAIFPTNMIVVTNEKGEVKVEVITNLKYLIRVYKTDRKTPEELQKSKYMHEDKEKNGNIIPPLYESEFILKEGSNEMEIEVE
ncbi:hypothetical protein ACEOWJ_002139 [Bacillus cereus]